MINPLPRRALRVCALTFAALCVPLGLAAAQELSWNELARRPELWPSECKLTRAIEFQNGTKVGAGDTCDVIEVRAGDVVLATRGDVFEFVAAADDTDVLAMARTAMAALTPEQRALTYPSLQQHIELWPYEVALTQPLQLAGGATIEKGSQFVMLRYEGPDLVVFDKTKRGTIVIDPKNTDVMQRARAALVAEKPPTPRLLRELAGKLVDLRTGQPTEFDAEHADKRPRFYAIYFSAGWCGPCRMFSPKLVEFYNAEKPKHDDFEVVFVSADHTAEEMAGYVKDESFPWFAVAYDRVPELAIVDSFRGGGIPQLLVLDEHGKLLADSYQNGRYIGADAALARLKALLNQPRPKPAPADKPAHATAPKPATAPGKQG